MVNITVQNAFYNVLRAYNLTTIFGNPGSTEQPLLQNFPSDFKYVLGLQEASVVGMADGHSQAINMPAVSVLHTDVGTGNAMGNIITAYLNRSPLIVIAGQQTREMLIGDPLLTDREAINLPKPYIKWSYETYRAQDAPAALVRAISIATMPPAGPVFLSVPSDDWEKYMQMEPPIRTVSKQIAPEHGRLAEFATRISNARNFTMVVGPEIDRSGGWAAAIKLAELLKCPVYLSPLADRISFPFSHPLFAGSLPIARGPLSTAITGRDLVLVVGAEVWRYYPYIPGPITPNGTEILQITNDPHSAQAALVGDSILSDSRLALEALYQLLQGTRNNTMNTTNASGSASTTMGTRAKSKRQTGQAIPGPAMPKINNGTSPATNATYMTALEAFQTIAMLRRPSDVLVQESPSNVAALAVAWPIVRQASYFQSASGGLGWGLPAAVGMALAQKNRTVICVIGDGSLHYSVQAIYTAVQEKLNNLIILVPRNEEYAILKQFAILEMTPNCPALDVPGLSATKIAESYGCRAYRADNTGDLYTAMQMARNMQGPALIEFQINPKIMGLSAKRK